MGGITTFKQSVHSLNMLKTSGLTARETIEVMAIQNAYAKNEHAQKAGIAEISYEVRDGRLYSPQCKVYYGDLANPPTERRTEDYREMPWHVTENLLAAEKLLLSGKVSALVIMSPAVDFAAEGSNKGQLYFMRWVGDRVVVTATDQSADIEQMAREAHSLYGIDCATLLGGNNTNGGGIFATTRIDCPTRQELWDVARLHGNEALARQYENAIYLGENIPPHEYMDRLIARELAAILQTLELQGIDIAADPDRAIRAAFQFAEAELQSIRAVTFPDQGQPELRAPQLLRTESVAQEFRSENRIGPANLPGRLKENTERLAVSIDSGRFRSDNFYRFIKQAELKQRNDSPLNMGANASLPKPVERAESMRKNEPAPMRTGVSSPVTAPLNRRTTENSGARSNGSMETPGRINLRSIFSRSLEAVLRDSGFLKATKERESRTVLERPQSARAATTARQVVTDLKLVHAGVAAPGVLLNNRQLLIMRRALASPELQQRTEALKGHLLQLRKGIEALIVARIVARQESGPEWRPKNATLRENPAVRAAERRLDALMEQLRASPASRFVERTIRARLHQARVVRSATVLKVESLNLKEKLQTLRRGEILAPRNLSSFQLRLVHAYLAWKNSRNSSARVATIRRAAQEQIRKLIALRRLAVSPARTVTSVERSLQRLFLQLARKGTFRDFVRFFGIHYRMRYRTNRESRVLAAGSKLIEQLKKLRMTQGQFLLRASSRIQRHILSLALREAARKAPLQAREAARILRKISLLRQFIRKSWNSKRPLPVRLRNVRRLRKRLRARERELSLLLFELLKRQELDRTIADLNPASVLANISTHIPVGGYTIRSGRYRMRNSRHRRRYSFVASRSFRSRASLIMAISPALSRGHSSIDRSR